MDRIYNHKLVEKGLEKKWRQTKHFIKRDFSKKPFSVLLPPPNITGKLHLGHALDTLIQDTLIRHKKLDNYDVFWITGMDHAGIATQAKVESVLYETEKLTKHDIGREKFLKKIWDWKEEYANFFREQWKKLGLALNYDLERFTLDKEANQAVLKVFVELYNQGLIYKDTKAVNWDVKLNTAVSNIETFSKQIEQKMYYIKYPLENSKDFLTIATVRTETLISDVAVVYNPNDTRYQNLVNKFVTHPITKKRLPIIADEYVDSKFGSGLMKLSAHSEVDIDIIKKHNLQIIETIDKHGFLNCKGLPFDKMTRFEAREKIAHYLKENNFLAKEELTTSNVAYSDRSNTPVEILVMPQWFVSMNKFSKDILDHIESSAQVKFYPKRFKKVLKQWMENIHDWTISRQLWWGHRIPAWYKGDQIKVQIESPGENWIQDEDVLDTWFSSGLSPFVFLGWPQSNDLLERYYPTDVLVTGYDLIFFWIARMYLFGNHFLNQKPFKHVLLHGLIRDEKGRKMSKSLNNGIDPMDVIEEFGSDSLRWFLITNTSPGLDIRFSKNKLKSAWALNNKLWNISRYIIQLPNDTKKLNLTDADKWINNKLLQLQNTIKKNMRKYEFTIIGSEISKFIFNDFSSWYVELIKSQNEISKKITLSILKNVLLIINPFLPFITYKIFEEAFNDDLYKYTYPKIKKAKNVEYIDTIIEIVKNLRKYREENQISKKELIYWDTDFEVSEIIENAINKLVIAKKEKNTDALIAINLGKIFIKINQKQKDLDKLRIIDEIEKIKFEIRRAKNILSNENFVKKAPKNLVKTEKTKLENYESELKKYEEELKCKY